MCARPQVAYEQRTSNITVSGFMGQVFRLRFAVTPLTIAYGKVYISFIRYCYNNVEELLLSNRSS